MFGVERSGIGFEGLRVYDFAVAKQRKAQKTLRVRNQRDILVPNPAPLRAHAAPGEHGVTVAVVYRSSLQLMQVSVGLGNVCTTYGTSTVPPCSWCGCGYQG